MLDLEELKALVNAATPGPWSDDQFDPYGAVISRAAPHAEWVGDYDGAVIGEAFSRKDAAFVAAARTAIVELIAEVERLQGELDSFERCDGSICIDSHLQVHCDGNTERNDLGRFLPVWHKNVSASIHRALPGPGNNLRMEAPHQCSCHHEEQGQSVVVVASPTWLEPAPKPDLPLRRDFRCEEDEEIKTQKRHGIGR